MNRYPLAPNSIWWGIQGEAHLRGFQMAFLRLAGCSVGCPGCDTDYSVYDKSSASDIAAKVDAVIPKAVYDRWVWITGGEPADHDLRELLGALRSKRISIAVATSGHKRIIPTVDWLSVSPHDPEKVIQVYGNELKIVDGLNVPLEAWEDADVFRGFMYRYVQPLWRDGAEDSESLQRCLEFLKRNPDWAISRQDHKYWNVP